jgi:hypothetical protein
MVQGLHLPEGTRGKIPPPFAKWVHYTMEERIMLCGDLGVYILAQLELQEDYFILFKDFLRVLERCLRLVWNNPKELDELKEDIVNVLTRMTIKLPRYWNTSQRVLLIWVPETYKLHGGWRQTNMLWGETYHIYMRACCKGSKNRLYSAAKNIGWSEKVMRWRNASAPRQPLAAPDAYITLQNPVKRLLRLSAEMLKQVTVKWCEKVPPCIYPTFNNLYQYIYRLLYEYIYRTI